MLDAPSSGNDKRSSKAERGHACAAVKNEFLARKGQRRGTTLAGTIPIAGATARCLTSRRPRTLLGVTSPRRCRRRRLDTCRSRRRKAEPTPARRESETAVRLPQCRVRGGNSSSLLALSAPEHARPNGPAACDGCVHGTNAAGAGQVTRPVRRTTPVRGQCGGVTFLHNLEAETVLSTSSVTSTALPCAVASCGATRTTTVPLTLGGRVEQVPACREHAEHWRAAEPYCRPRSNSPDRTRGEFDVEAAA